MFSMMMKKTFTLLLCLVMAVPVTESYYIPKGETYVG
jgi:hypothetical protein